MELEELPCDSQRCAWLDLYFPATCISFNGSDFKGLTAFLHLINSLSSCYVLWCVQWKGPSTAASLKNSNNKKSLLSSAFPVWQLFICVECH